MHTDIHARVQTQTHTDAHRLTCTRTHTHSHLQTNAPTHTDTHTHTHANTHTHIHSCSHGFIRLSTKFGSDEVDDDYNNDRRAILLTLFVYVCLLNQDDNEV